ncbi:hypothetical protein [Nonomuraea sp. C10]|uniref:hypothetical protein n=1 Tax=Nonomuraea sp. C10 TaxID=2600577 RepID=UPI0011CD7BE6|nr:hypothetical protein [Nonomuraea sp. C10]TXK34239.1 hypothetical protein FR742_33140 [Nonomuraea sp. C10]
MSQTRQDGDQADPSGHYYGDPGQQPSRKWTKETVLAVLSLALAVTVLFFGDGWFRGEDDPPPAAATASPSTHPSSTAPSSSAPTPSQTPSPEPSAAPSVRYTGVVRLGAGVDLDQLPPTIRTSDENADITESSSWFVPSIKAHEQSLAPWSESTAPTRQQCVEALSTQGTTEWGESGKEEVETGAIFCLRTSEGRIAAMKMKDGSYHNMRATVKVWDPADSL